MTPEEALSHWYAALERELGIILTLPDVNDKRRIENLLYDVRKTSGDPALQVLSIVRPGDAPEELWIIKKTTDMSDLGNPNAPST